MRLLMLGGGILLPRNFSLIARNLKVEMNARNEEYPGHHLNGGGNVRVV